MKRHRSGRHQRHSVRISWITTFSTTVLLFLSTTSGLGLALPLSTGHFAIQQNSTIRDNAENTSLSMPQRDSPMTFNIQKDPTDSSRLLNVFLPSNFEKYKQFIAKVTDISPAIEFPVRDVNRTFLASPTDSSVINIHGLNPGHQYTIAVYGRIEGDSQLIKEESVIMDPLPLNFSGGLTNAIVATHTNITMRASKVEKALQDTFRVEYVQLDPPKRYPILDVHDIPDQKDVELYLGNLNPGRDYNVMVTSLRNGLPSRPWKGVITTKPLKPGQLLVQDLNATCINLSWILPPESGADRFKIAYGVINGEKDMTKFQVPYVVQQVDLCKDIVAGHGYIFAVIAEKSNQISDPATISHTVKPLSAKDIQVSADFGQNKYRIDVLLPPRESTKIDKCIITVNSEELEKMEEVVKVEDRNTTSGAPLKCSTFMDLTPGKRYDMSAATQSGAAAGIKIFRSLALEPGFDMKSFGFSVAELKGVLKFDWPESEVALKRIQTLWGQIVGDDSLLHINVLPIGSSTIIGPGDDESTKEQPKQMDTSPTKISDDTNHLVVDNLRRGGCYKVQMYTVTSSGIVSTTKFEEYVRISAPLVGMNVSQITKNTAVLALTMITSQDNAYAVSSDVSECNLSIIVVDTQNTVIYDKTIRLVDAAMPTILFEGLRPFHKYSVNSNIFCGEEKDNVCPQKSRHMNTLSFETKQDRPGPVQNLSIKALNPYSVHTSWLPPSLPNGVITHYIINVHPLDTSEKPWTVNVGANLNAARDAVVEAVVDNLIGGQDYRITVQAVTEAGTGDLPAVSESVKIEMPIMAPPRPASRIEVLPNTIRSTDLTIRYNTAMFSTKHGLLTKAAVIVAHVSPDGKTNENWIFDSPNKTLTWAQIQRFDVWPPYVAVETPIEPLKRFAPRSVSEVVGIDMTCSNQDPTTICNGPLRPGSGYRFKLRLYTAPNLWTDTLYSDVVVTEPLQGETAFRTFIVACSLLILGALLAFIFFIFVNKQRGKKQSPLFFLSNSRPFATSNNTTRYANSKQQQHRASKESQWTALKMIMAERAADGLAKLGLCTGGSTTATAGNNNLSKQAPPCSMDSPTPMEGIIIANGSSPPGQLTTLTVNGVSMSPNFNPHHRRSKSLRERTGVDQRLERLPSGPPPGQKSILWTVIKGTNVDKTRPVRICDFLEHVRLMSADSDFRFSEEYEDLRFVGNGQTCIAADLTVNRSKNRFTNILPFDHSRVKLVPTDDEEGSDYINANYIPGFNSRREFIAAQGPLPSTRDDFWRVVWEQQCPAILALTKCIEKGRDKCHQYWPDNSQRSWLYGDIEVTLLNECIYDDFVIRELRLTNMREAQNGIQSARNVTHFHYQAWPDFGVPEDPTGIVNFVRLFRSILPPAPTNKPTIVHCSAGVGRSGSFVAIDRLLQHIEVGKHIDVYGTVYEMRLERCHMVQNEQQYIFIHHCLAFILEHYYSHLVNVPASKYNNYAPSPGPVLNELKSFVVPPVSAMMTTPRIEVHQNPAFIEDDEGIAESGL